MKIKNKNKSIYDKRCNFINNYFTVIVAVAVAICLIFLATQDFRLDGQMEWITFIVGFLTILTPISLGVIVYYQNQWHFSDVDIQREKDLHREEQYRIEMEKNREQDLRIKTNPYIAFKDVDLIEPINLIYMDGDNETLLMGNYEENNHKTIMLRFVVECELDRGLKCVDTSEAVLVGHISRSEKDGTGDKYIFKKNLANKESNVSYIGNNTYQYTVCLMAKDRGNQSVNEILKTLLDDEAFFNIIYTATNIYGFEIKGTIKFKFNTIKQGAKYFIKNINNVSNWIDNIN